MEINNKIRSLINEIAKIILLRVNFSKNNSLFYGKIGATCFLYIFEKYFENEIYYNLANEVMLEVVTNNNDENFNYSDGLAGIGWGINFLREKRFIEIDSNSNIFSTIDKRILQNGSYIRIGKDLCGISSYFFSMNRIPFNTQDELIFLMRSEWLITQIDKIDQNKEILNVTNKIDYLKQILKAENDSFLAHLVNIFFYSTIILKKSYITRLYPVIVKDSLEKVLEGILVLIINISDHILQSKNLNSSRKVLYSNFLLRLFNAYIQNPLDKKSNLSKIATSNFILALSKLQNRYLKANYNRLDNSIIKLEIESIAHLNRIISAVENNDLYSILILKIEKIVSRLSNKETLIKCFTSNIDGVEVGLTGLSGLGLIFLSILYPETIDWDEAILIS